MSVLYLRGTDGKFYPVETIRGPQGPQGQKGDVGPQGPAYTLNAADKAEIVAAVIESLGGNPVFGYVDPDTMTIVLKNAPDGEYNLAYIKEDGTISAPIGSMVKDTNVYYSVTNTLTNCTSNNSAKQVVEGESYSATITANSGYELKSVTVTMGGSPVTVSGGNISIAEVTGDIVITAVAEEVQASYTNLADPTSADWWEDSRVGSDGTRRNDSPGNITTNPIAIKKGDVIRVQGLDLVDSIDGTEGPIRCAIYNSSMGIVSHATFAKQTGYFSGITASKTGGSGTYTSSANGYIRFGGKPNNTSADIVITLNEPIE